MRGLLAFWCVLAAAYSLTGVAQLGDPGTPGDGGTEWPSQKCSGSGSCGAVPAQGGPCPSDQAPCCCKIAPAVTYVCACRTTESCLHPGPGNHCDDSKVP